jgi:hypothetical protein
MTSIQNPSKHNTKSYLLINCFLHCAVWCAFCDCNCAYKSCSRSPNCVRERKDLHGIAGNRERERETPSCTLLQLQTAWWWGNLRCRVSCHLSSGPANWGDKKPRNDVP